MYTKFYGLSEKPFEDFPDPRFLYPTLNQQDVLASIIGAIEHRTGFACVTGGVGTGKTILVHRLRSMLDERVETVLIFNAPATFNEVLRSILTEFGGKAKMSRQALLADLDQYLRQKADAGKTVALIIDEAQNLSEETLGKLAKLPESCPRAGEIQIIFVGQPGFEELLHSENLDLLNRKMKIRHQIRSLDGFQSREYIDHRLKLVGSGASDVFTPEAIARIITDCQGIPRLLNVFCDNALILGYKWSKKKIDVEIIENVARNIEGPPADGEIAIPSTAPAGKGRPAGPGKKFFRTRTLLAALLLLCAGAIWIWVQGPEEQKPPAVAAVQPVSQIVKEETPKTTSSSPIAPQAKDSAEPSQAELLKPDQTDRVGRIEEVVVRGGETISSLVKKHYGISNRTVVDFILEFNPEITNAHLIRVSQRIKIPSLDNERLILHSPDHGYKIHVGTFVAPGFAKYYSDEPALRGKRVEVQPRSVSPRETWYRISVGKFNNREEANSMIELLKKKGLLPLFGGKRLES
jgi:type II secretory pathway predicted ATPase ExeA